MRILVDADACPVKEIIIKIAKKHSLEVIMFFDRSHIYEDGYSTVLLFDKGRDSVDFALLNRLKSNDIVISQDYGVATLALSKNAYVLNQNGLIYNDDNINTLLYKRYISAKQRKNGKHLKGPKKRTKDLDLSFEQSLIKIIESSKNKARKQT